VFEQKLIIEGFGVDWNQLSEAKSLLGMAKTTDNSLL